jgi:hypothetical protein
MQVMAVWNFLQKTLKTLICYGGGLAPEGLFGILGLLSRYGPKSGKMIVRNSSQVFMIVYRILMITCPIESDSSMYYKHITTVI